MSEGINFNPSGTFTFMLAFAEKHPEYSEEKWIEIIQKTWRKMSTDAHEFALSGQLKLPEALIPLIQSLWLKD